MLSATATTSTGVGATESVVFTPLKVGAVELGHRIVLAPCTRLRAEADHTPSGT